MLVLSLKAWAIILTAGWLSYFVDGYPKSWTVILLSGWLSLSLDGYPTLWMVILPFGWLSYLLDACDVFCVFCLILVASKRLDGLVDFCLILSNVLDGYPNCWMVILSVGWLSQALGVFLDLCFWLS